MDLVCFPRPPPSKTRRGLPDGVGSTAQGAAQGSGPQLPPPDGIPDVPVQVTPSVHFAFPVSEAASWPPLHPAATQGMEQWVLQLDMAQIPWEHPSLGAARPIFSLNSGFFPFTTPCPDSPSPSWSLWTSATSGGCDSPPAGMRGAGVREVQPGDSFPCNCRAVTLVQPHWGQGERIFHQKAPNAEVPTCFSSYSPSPTAEAAAQRMGQSLPSCKVMPPTGEAKPVCTRRL